MHLSVVAYGTWGDVRPGIALGRALRDHGHRVRLIVTENFERLIDDVGLEVVPMPVDKFHLTRRVSTETSPARIALAIRREVAPELLRAGRSLLSLADDTDAFIVNHWLLGMAASIAEDRSLGLIWMAMQPRIRTREIPFCTWPPLPDWAPFRGAYNLASYRAASFLHWWTYVRVANELRTADLNLPPWTPGEYADLLDQTPSVILVSRHVLPRPHDWADHQRMTGFLFYEEEGWKPPSGLERFIEAGPAPVYVGFGSLHDRNPERTTRVLLDAVEQAGRRAVLHSGWAGLGRMHLPPSVYPLEFAPHTWLFPSMAAVVHHAGAGTSAASLRAGVPSVTVPHSGDQGFWARRLHRMGAAAEPLPRSQLEAADLADRIRAAVESPELRRRAGEIGGLVRSEHGEGAAVAAVKEFLSQE